MNKKMKMTVDILMTIVLFICMSYQFTGGKNHEIAGAVMMILFILHHLLNKSWYKNLFKGNYTGVRIFQTIVDFALLAIMLIEVISGIAMSRHVFKFLDLGLSPSNARPLHMMFAYAGFLLMSFHIGLHYGMIMNMFRKITRIKTKNTFRTLVLRFIAILLAGYGVFALTKHDFIANILMINQFTFSNYKGYAIFFIADYFAIMALMIFIAYYLQKLILELSHKNKV